MKVSIIGAGFSGLTLAYYLIKRGFQVDVFEAKDRPGGMINSLHTEKGIVETAATSILLGQELEELLTDIKLTPLYPRKESRKRYILRDLKPRRLPLNFVEILSLIKGILSLVFIKKRHTPRSQETLANWGGRVFSAQVSRKLISPALQGIYAEGADSLSASLVLKRLFSKEKRSKSKGPINFKNGMGQFIKQLETYLKEQGVTFHYSYIMSKDKLPLGPKVFATSMAQAKVFIEGLPEVDLKNMTSATLFFNRPSPLKGFGVLFPKEESLSSLGVLLNDSMFEGRTTSGHSETWILSDVSSLSDEEVIKKILIDRKKIFSTGEAPENSIVNHWEGAFPSYGPKLEKALEQGLDLPKETYLTGNYLGNLGLSGILTQNKDLSFQIQKDLQ